EEEMIQPCNAFCQIASCDPWFLAFMEVYSIKTNINHGWSYWRRSAGYLPFVKRPPIAAAMLREPCYPLSLRFGCAPFSRPQLDRPAERPICQCWRSPLGARLARPETAVVWQAEFDDEEYREGYAEGSERKPLTAAS